MKKKNIDIINYVDDFACVTSCEQEAVVAAGNIIDETISDSGLLLAHKKSVNATLEMTFLGIIFNSSKMTMEVTEDLIVDIQEELKNWAMKRKAMKKDIQSLAGVTRKNSNTL